jgi:DNA (cytosine-5)-methyltransferase 1
MDGEVDERDIRDVRPIDIQGFLQVHMFCGIAGWALALRRAAWPDHQEVWTGSSPCQPFSQAGKRLGFADDRHLWPYWRYLIAVRRPSVVLGEQVSSASEWLGLVRGDLEALGYAVGAMPVEAASAGADHLRDRYWFVAHDEHAREGWGRVQRPGEGASAIAIRAPDKLAGPSNNGVALGDACGAGLAQRERLAGVQREALGASARQDSTYASHSFDMGNASLAGAGRQRSSSPGPQAQGGSERERPEQPGIETSCGDDAMRCDMDWVLGADGKARRVKPGIRLLAHGVPNRVAKLRAFGNAIDPRPAEAFIRSVMETLDSPPQP